MSAQPSSIHENVINQKRLHIGMTIRSLARRANMDDDLLGKKLHGKRKMTASELIKLSAVLGLTLEDYPVETAKAV